MGAPIWQRKDVIHPYKWGPTFDWIRFSKEVLNGVRYIFSFEQGALAECLYSQRVFSLAPLVCDCFSDPDDSATRDACYKVDNAIANVPLGAMLVCSGQPRVFNTPPYYIESSPTSVVLGCGEVQLSAVSAASFYDTPAARLSTSFIPRKQVAPYEIVTNESGEFVGQIVGDGLQVTIRVQDSLTNMTVCIDKRLVRLEGESVGVFDVEDFAVTTDVNITNRQCVCACWRACTERKTRRSNMH